MCLCGGGGGARPKGSSMAKGGGQVSAQHYKAYLLSQSPPPPLIICRLTPKENIGKAWPPGGGVGWGAVRQGNNRRLDNLPVHYLTPSSLHLYSYLYLQLVVLYLAQAAV